MELHFIKDMIWMFIHKLFKVFQTLIYTVGEGVVTWTATTLHFLWLHPWQRKFSLYGIIIYHVRRHWTTLIVAFIHIFWHKTNNMRWYIPFFPFSVFIYTYLMILIIVNGNGYFMTLGNGNTKLQDYWVRTWNISLSLMEDKWEMS